MTEGSDKQLDDIYIRAKEFFDDKGDKEGHVVELLGPYLNIRTTHSYAWLMYGDSLRVLGRYKEALPALKKGLELAPPEQKGFVCARIGMLCASSGSLTEAEQWYDLAMQSQEETLGWMWIFRGTNFAKMCEFGGALECFHESLKKDDVDKEESYLNIGCVLRAMGKYSEAIEAFQKALEIDPHYCEAQSALKGLQGIQDTRERASHIEALS